MPIKVKVKEGRYYRGQRLNAITILRYEGRNYYRIRCNHCGTVRSIQLASVRRNEAKPLKCWCSSAEKNKRHRTSHGETRTELYSRWSCMMERCYRPKCNGYERYGGRGIRVCKRWHSYENFKQDMGPTFRSGLTLDRKDNDKDYHKDNCRWSTWAEQARNKSNPRLILRTYQGKLLPLTKISELTGIALVTLSARVRRGWSDARLTLPPTFSRHAQNQKAI